MSQTYTLNVEPMTCEACSNAIKNVLKKLGDQVQDVETDVSTKTVKVTTSLPLDEIIEKLKKAGRTAKAI